MIILNENVLKPLSRVFNSIQLNQTNTKDGVSISLCDLYVILFLIKAAFALGADKLCHTVAPEIGIQTLPKCCNLPNIHMHTPTLRRTSHLVLPATARSPPQSLSLPVCLSLVLLGWAQTPAVCLCSGQAQTHLPSSACSQQWLSKTCQPARTLCRIPGWTAHANVTCKKKSCTYMQLW